MFTLSCFFWGESVISFHPKIKLLLHNRKIHSFYTTYLVSWLTLIIFVLICLSTEVSEDHLDLQKHCTFCPLYKNYRLSWMAKNLHRYVTCSITSSWQYSISKTHSTSNDNSSLLIKATYSFCFLCTRLLWTWCRLSSFKFTWSYVVKYSISHPDMEFYKTTICTALHITVVWSSWHSNHTGRKWYFLYMLVQWNL